MDDDTRSGAAQEYRSRMRVVTNVSELRTARIKTVGPFGLVPTMGALHEGHISLVRRAVEECDHVGVSIFVNPSQFGPDGDLEKYPRTIQKDLAILEDLGVALAFTPRQDSMYLPGYQTWVTVEEVAMPLEGRVRPDHFRGVATIVAKLFNCFLPDRAYFGQKDAQQVSVIRRMVADLNFPVDIVVCPTVRESDGLAKSSRNIYLSPEERKAATVLFRALAAARKIFEQGERRGDALRMVIQSVIDSEHLACVEYISVADPETLHELDVVDLGASVLFSLAVRIGKTHLIDNMLI